MKTLNFEEIRDQWCKSYGFEDFEDYRNSMTISDDEYKEIAEAYADQFRLEV